MCVSVSIGFDFLAHSLSEVMNRYVEFYKRPDQFEYQRKNHPAGAENEDIVLEHQDGFVKFVGLVYRNAVQNDKVGTENEEFDLILQYPVTYIKRQKVKGTIEFGLQIQARNNFSTSQNKNVWTLALNHYPRSHTTDIECRENEKSHCNTFDSYM